MTGGHFQPIYARAKPRRFAQLPAPVNFDIAVDARRAGHCHWQIRPDAHPTLLLLHGLEDPVTALHRRMAGKAWAASCNVVRLNQRNFAGLYHSELSSGPVFVTRELIRTGGIRDVAVAGYSFGGSLPLKLARDASDGSLPELRAVGHGQSVRRPCCGP